MRDRRARRWSERLKPLSALRNRRAHATSGAMATSARILVQKALPGSHDLTVEPTTLQKRASGSRNRASKPVQLLDAVTLIHEHCAVYTEPETVEVLLDLVGWTVAEITGDAKLLEPACGDGSFLLPAIERLLVWARARSDVDLAPMIRAYEFEPRTVEALQRAIVVLLRRHGLSDEIAVELAAIWVRCEDFLLAEPDFACTHAVGNPPYMRWSLVPNGLRTAYETALPKAAARGDLCLSFLWKATEFATGKGSRIGFLCADRWLRCAYGRAARAALGLSHSLRTHIEVHGLPVFKGVRKVGAYAAVTVLERGAGEVPTRFGKATSIDHLRELAKTKTERRQSFRSIWPTKSEGGARLAAHDIRDMLETVDRNAPLLGDVGVTIRCGTALGLAKAFVVQSDTDIEAERVLPYLRSRDLDEDGGISPQVYVANVWTCEGALLDLSLAPLLAYHLERFRKELEARACVNDKADWYRTIDKLHARRIAEPKVLVAGMSRRARIAYDPGGHVASNALYCLVSTQWPLDALATSLRAGVLDLFGDVLSPRFSGGTKRFDGNVLRQVQLPVWNSISVPVRRRIEARDSSDGFDAALVADLFKLRASSQRATLERILTEIDDMTPSDGARA